MQNDGIKGWKMDEMDENKRIFTLGVEKQGIENSSSKSSFNTCNIS